jgi:hypothetical protein
MNISVKHDGVHFERKRADVIGLRNELAERNCLGNDTTQLPRQRFKDQAGATIAARLTMTHAVVM